MKKKNFKQLIKNLKELKNKYYCEDFSDDTVYESYINLKDDIVSTIKLECLDFVELLITSGIIELAYGDISNDRFIAMDAESLFISDDNSLVIEAGNIYTGSKDMPQDMIDWFSKRYVIYPVDREENSNIQ